ncbi:MAG: hypothetical protein R3F30_08070 [Planctomycetota bacterium]
MLSTAVDWEMLGNTLLLGLSATLWAVLLGTGTAWLCNRTDMPGARWIGMSALLPILFPPILVAASFTDLCDARGFVVIGLVMAVAHMPFTLALTARGLRSVDGRLYEACLLARGRGAAERMLLRQVLPDILAGALLVLVFVVTEHGVPEFLSVKGKPWRVYSEAVFLKWSVPDLPGSLRSAEATAFSVPLIAVCAVFAWLCLRARRRGSLVTLAGDFRPLPVRRLGRWRWPALLLALAPVTLGLVVPTWRMAAWTAGATANKPMGLDVVKQSFRMAWADWGGNLGYTLLVAALVGLVVIALGGLLGWYSARGRRPWIEGLTMATLAVPAILLGVGFIRLWNRGGLLSDLYESPAALVAAYATRFLPLGVLALANAWRRVPRELEEAGVLTGRGTGARLLGLRLPLVAGSLGSVWILAWLLSLRELDLAVLLKAGNSMAVRPISNAVHFGYEDKAAALSLMLLVCAAAPLIVRLLATGKTGEATS